MEIFCEKLHQKSLVKPWKAEREVRLKAEVPLKRLVRLLNIKTNVERDEIEDVFGFRPKTN